MDYKTLVKKFRTKKALVIGDIMLDEYLHGTVERISPEAPVQIMKYTHNTTKLGGAANVADNLAELGCDVWLCGTTGYDKASKVVSQLCREKNIKQATTTDPNLQTIIKQRLVTNNHHLMRIDYEKRLKPPVLPKKSYDVIIVSDYNKGTITPDFMQNIRKTFEGTPIIIDPHSAHENAESVEMYRNTTVIKPNLQQAVALSGITYETDADLHAIITTIQRKYKTQAVITLGPGGIAVMDCDVVKHVPTQAKEVYDVTGAGDTTTAVLALSIACGATLYEAAVLANKAAGLVVQKFGTATINANELADTISENTKIKTLSELKSITKELRKQGKRVVFTNGCFDILHKMHAHLLKQSKAQGDILIVALNTDAGIKKLKGKDRPFVNQKDRAELLSSFESVDYITFFGTHTPIKIIKALTPDVITKGGDYTENTVCGATHVKQHGGRVVLIPYEQEYSTTKLAKRMRTQCKKTH